MTEWIDCGPVTFADLDRCLLGASGFGTLTDFDLPFD